jgi:hypothetical protein
MGVISIGPRRLIKPVPERNNEIVGAWLAVPDRMACRARSLRLSLFGFPDSFIGLAILIGFWGPFWKG